MSKHVVQPTSVIDWSTSVVAGRRRRRLIRRRRRRPRPHRQRRASRATRGRPASPLPAPPGTPPTRCATGARAATATSCAASATPRAGLPARRRGDHRRADLVGNDVELLVNGDRIFPCFLETIREARADVCLLTYAYWRGDIADEVADALCERARAGVECNVIIDAMGGVQMEPDVVRADEDGGVRVSRFRPPKPYAVRRLANRTHRKILVADGCVGLTGGVGIAEEWTGDAQDPDHWRDTHVRVRGPSCAGSSAPSRRTGSRRPARYWSATATCPSSRSWRAAARCSSCARARASATPTSRRSTTSRSPRRASRSTSPPPTSCRARRSPTRWSPRPSAACGCACWCPGEHIDKAPVRVGGRASYDELLDAGVELYEYGPTMLHAKSLVLDGVWSSVGSVNFDNRSFQLNDEATLCVQSEAFAGELTRAVRARPRGRGADRAGAMVAGAGRSQRGARVGAEARAARALSGTRQRGPARGPRSRASCSASCDAALQAPQTLCGRSVPRASATTC